MTYNEANEKLQGRNSERRKIDNNTYLERRGEKIAIRLHNTDIITLSPDGSQTVDVENWQTVTTKDRLNNYLEGYSIHQERGVWYLSRYGEKVAVYQNGMRILADGTLEGVEALSRATAKLKLRKRVHKYAAGYIAAMKAGKVEAPGLGDCLYCGMRTEQGETLGESTKDRSHLESHLAEKYYVPSLLARSLEVMPSSIAMKDTVYRCWQNKDCKGWGDWTWQQIQKNLSRYILRQMG